MPPHALSAQTPHAWVSDCIRIATQDGVRVSRFRIEGRASPRERKWTQHSHVQVGPDADAEALTDQINVEVENLGARFARVVALLPNSQLPVATRPWSTAYDDDVDDDDGDPDDARGAMARIVGQALRHSEAFAARMQTMADHHVANLQRQNAQLLEMQNALIAERLQVAQSQRDTIIAQADEAATRKRTDALTEGGMMILSAFAYKLTGGNIGGDGKLRTLIKILQTIGRSITDEQAEKMAGILSPEQFAALASVTDDPAAKVAQVEKAKKDANTTSGDSE